MQSWIVNSIVDSDPMQDRQIPQNNKLKSRPKGGVTDGKSGKKDPAEPILPARRQASIVGTRELNDCVRKGNRCGLSVISTGMVEG